MKTTKKILNIVEQIFKPTNSLGISRKDMPQVEDENQEDFLNYLKSLKIHFKKDKMSVSEMKPAQNELSLDASKNLLKTNSKKLDKPIIVSSDDYVIDGHHRWLALKLKDDNFKADIIRVNMKAEKLIDMVKKYPKVKFKSIDNKVMEKVSQSELDKLELLLDKLFKSLNIDIEFTKHFLDRVNDSRNGKDITTAELAELFGAVYQKHGKRLKTLPPETEAVIKDIRSDINVPFAIELNKNGMLELISKTVMRKKNFMTSNEIIKVGEMKLAKRIFQALNEKLVIVNKGKTYGQVVYLAGGGASGKGFSASKFLDLNKYKKFDVDVLKELILKVAKLKGHKELAGLDLKKPQDVFTLHQYVKDHNIEDNMLDTFFKSVKQKSELPNIVFDITFKDTKNYFEKKAKLDVLGYKPEDTHLVWVLADYSVAIEQNQKRSRVVPDDIVFKTHTGVAETMSSILKGNLPEGLDGEIYVIFSDQRLSVGRESNKVVGKNSKGEDIKYVNIDDFLYVKVKDAGKPIKPEAEIKKEIFGLAKEMVPKEVKDLF